jgi:hypothetical protein
VIIGSVPDPLNWERWDEAKALLEPARRRGDFPSVIEPDEALWAVMDGNELIAVATAWLSSDHYVEVKLIGGRDHKRWLAELDRVIGKAGAAAGATRMMAIGRAGWWRNLKARGWNRIGEIEDHVLYSREV